MASAGAKSCSGVFGPVNVSAEVEQILRLLKVSISKRAVVRTSLAKDLPAVRGNVAQIRQVLMNLITNASEALSGNEGAITVATDVVHLAASTVDELFSAPEGDYVRLTGSDTGCGMTSDTRARIFDQFFTMKSTGRGLGLAAVHGLVRSLGGAIHVESAPGVGSTFEVLFPSISASKLLRPAPAARAADGQCEQAGALRRRASLPVAADAAKSLGKRLYPLLELWIPFPRILHSNP